MPVGGNLFHFLVVVCQITRMVKLSVYRSVPVSAQDDDLCMDEYINADLCKLGFASKPGG